MRWEAGARTASRICGRLNIRLPPCNGLRSSKPSCIPYFQPWCKREVPSSRSFSCTTTKQSPLPTLTLENIPVLTSTHPIVHFHSFAGYHHDQDRLNQKDSSSRVRNVVNDIIQCTMDEGREECQLTPCATGGARQPAQHGAVYGLGAAMHRLSERQPCSSMARLLRRGIRSRKARVMTAVSHDSPRPLQ